MNLIINKNVLLGMHLLSSRDSSRSIICNTVNLEIAGRDCIIVATDGRRLGACNSGIVTGASEPLSLTFQVPVKMLKAIEGNEILIDHDPATRPAVITIKTKTKGVKQNTLTVSLEEGNYPRWRQVIPPAGQPGLRNTYFNWRLMEGFVKVAETILGKPSPFNSPGIHVSQTDALSPIVIRIDCVDFIGVLMPMRKDNATTIPQWAKEAPQPATAATAPDSNIPNLAAQLS